MPAALFPASSTRLSHRLMPLLILVVLLLGFFPASQNTPGPLRAQPELMQLIAQHPRGHVGVIVQKLGTDQRVERLVVQLGGVVTKDLSIINAFAAELPTLAVEALARAPGVRWVSLDAPTVDTQKGGGTTTTTCTDCINTAPLQNTYNRAVGADKVWNTAPYLQGQGVTVAVVDSGVNQHNDFTSPNNGPWRLIANFKTSTNAANGSDYYGHGTHVAGIIAGNGTRSSGGYVGIAPKANIINVKVSDDYGSGTASDVVAGLQWILENKATYNIKVVNISLNSAVPESYHTNPLCAAAEILWFNGITVVVSAGNAGKNALYPPANDPFVITVGATDTMGTAEIKDDIVANYSGYGTTTDGFQKPDLVAPGSNIIAPLSNGGGILSTSYPAYKVNDYYFRMSGTSMAAPVVAGAAALLLQDEPNLTPDQVKYRLMATATKGGRVWPNYNVNKANAGYLNIPAAVSGTTTQSANTNIQASQLLWSGSEAVTWNSVNWNSVNWNSVNWNSVNWNSVNWNSVNWNSTYFGD